MSEPRLKVKPRPGQSAAGSGTPSDLAPLTALAAEEPTARLNVQIPATMRQQQNAGAVWRRVSARRRRPCLHFERQHQDRQRTLVRTTARPYTENLASVHSSGVGDAACGLIRETQ